jgi:8-oxo-dGTP pyrophosphatase MutT (NUDIX family)
MARSDSAFAVILRHDRVLLVQPWFKRRWQLPGGSLEPGETPRKAALREVMEETGMAARIARSTGIYPRRDGTFAFVFAAHVGRDERPRGHRHEIRKQRWFSAAEALRRLSSGARQRLSEAFDSAPRSRRPSAAGQILACARRRKAPGSPGGPTSRDA